MSISAPVKKISVLVCGLLLAGLCDAQTVGLRYGQSGFTKDLGQARSNVAGLFVEQPLGRRFSLSSGLNYSWLNDAAAVYFEVGCFPPSDGDYSPTIGVKQRVRLLELPLDAGYSLLGTTGSRAQLKLTAGVSYVRVLRNRETWFSESGRTNTCNYSDDLNMANLLGVKAGLEEEIRFGHVSLALGIQYRQANLNPINSWRKYGNTFLYLKAGWQLRKRAAS